MRRRRHRLSITLLFTGATLVPLLAVGVLMLYLGVQTAQRVSNSLGQEVMSQAALRVQESVRDYLHHAERTSDVFADLVFSGALPERELKPWHVYMLSHLRTTPEVASIGFASAANDYTYLMRYRPELEYAIGVGAPDGAHMNDYIAHLDGRIGPPARPDSVFEVWRRPWYQSAVNAKGPTWTPAYTWFNIEGDPPRPEFSVAYTRALHDPKTGRFIGVLSIDTLLTQLNVLLRELAQPLEAVLIITDNEQVLIASSDLGPGVVTLPPGRRMSDIQNPVAQVVAAEIQRAGAQKLRLSASPARITVKGQSYWVGQSKLSPGAGTEWFVTVALPQQPILAQAQTSIRWIISLGTAYITFAGVVSILLARLLTRPLRRLAVFAHDVGAGNFERTIEVGSARELADLAEALNGMALNLRERVQLLAQRDAAEQAAGAKSRLIAHVSHEFRTPLNAIIGYAELLRDQATARPSDEKDAGNILIASQHLLALVENLLDLSAVEAGRLHLEMIDFSIAKLMDDVAIASRPVVERNHNRLHVIAPPVDVRMTSDPTRVRQILINLVGNAGKFTDEGDVTLRADVDADAGVVRFEVADTGPGIPADRLQRLFEPFGHVSAAKDQRHQPRAGAGLGLAISQQLSHSLGGEIVPESGPTGTRMRVTLPLRRTMMASRTTR